MGVVKVLGSSVKGSGVGRKVSGGRVKGLEIGVKGFVGGVKGSQVGLEVDLHARVLQSHLRPGKRVYNLAQYTLIPSSLRYALTVVEHD